MLKAASTDRPCVHYASCAPRPCPAQDDSSSSSGSDSDSSDDDAPPRGKAVHNRDGTLATASKAELKLAAELAKDPWGR